MRGVESRGWLCIEIKAIELDLDLNRVGVGVGYRELEVVGPS